MSSIGAILKDARTKKDVSLEEVHAKIKIHPRVLQILEEGKFEKLPSPLFVKSFLKSYAEFLELNPREIMEAYEKEGRQEPEQVIFLKSTGEHVKSPDVPETQNKLLVGAVAAVFILTVGFIAFLLVKNIVHWFPKKIKSHAVIKESLKEKEQEKKEPSADKQESKAKPEDKKEPEQEHSKSSPKTEWLCSIDQSNFPKLKKNSSLQLKIKALDSVWIRITCDGKVLFESTLKKGNSNSWTASKTIEIWTGNAGGMFLTLNRFSLGSPGKGSVKKMLLTHEGLKATG